MRSISGGHLKFFNDKIQTFLNLKNWQLKNYKTYSREIKEN